MAAKVINNSSTRSDIVHCHEHCPRRAYLELTVPKDAQEVTSVSFTTVSRDQGWADNKDMSHTWFEVALRRPGARSDLGSIRLHENRVAEAEFFEATSRWDIQQQPHLQTTAWLRSLQPEDVVQIIPRAVYQGWVNIIREASIRIEYRLGSPDLPQPIPPYSQPNYYLPLRYDHQQIRVLVINPGETEDTIEAHFEHVDLGKSSDHTGFDALSYCWGDAAEKANISLETETGRELFSISRIVERAIQRLRPRDSPLRIWIDAVCIDQNNNQERSQQVGMMGKIYSRAATVHIWLDEGHPGLEVALRIIRDIHNRRQYCCPGGDECGCSGTRHRFRQEEIDAVKQPGGWVSYGSMWEILKLHYRDYRTNPLGPYLVEAAGGEGRLHLSHLMQNLFQSPWFQRVWVVQEALLSRQAFVHYGPETIGWEELLMVSHMLESPEHRAQAPKMRGQLLMPSIWNKLGYIGNPGDSKLTILEVFLAGLDMRATDPRDKLFALLPFGKETSATIPPALRPDYTKSPEMVMANFTRWWIKEYRSLDILSLIHCHPLRTWQRTLSDNDPRNLGPIPRPTWAIGTEGFSTWSRMTLVGQFPSFQASRNTTPDEQLLDQSPQDSLTLMLRGRKVGQLVAVGLPQRSAIRPDHTRQAGQPVDIHTVFHRMFDLRGKTGVWIWPLSANIQDVGGTAAPSQRRDDGLHDHVAAHTRYFPAPVQHILRPIADDGSYESSFVEGELPSCMERCFFVASNGLYGLCPWTAKEGDIISVLDGGKVPFLIRTTVQDGRGLEMERVRYELVGECFIPGGIMSGDDAGSGVTDTEIFELV